MARFTAFLSLYASLAADPGPGSAKRFHRSVAEGWVCVGRAGAMPDENLGTLNGYPARNLGYIRIASDDGRKLDFWRTEVLAGLRESGLIRDETDVRALLRWRSAYGVRRAPSPTNIAAVIFRAGDLVRGGEKFLRDLAMHHRREGFEPVLVEAGPGDRAKTQKNNDVRDIRIGGTVPDIRRFLLESDVSLVHAISGIGFDVAKAIRFANMTFVCGLHGDCVPPAHEPDLAAVNGAVPSQQELLSIFESADAIYASSRTAQKAIEEAIGVRCPVVADVPLD